MRGQAFVAAAMLAGSMAFAQPAAAQQYRTYHDAHVANHEQCQQSRNSRTAAGALIGGVAGALLGREVADRGVRGEGTILGAVVGAAAGGAIARNTTRCDRVPQGAYDPYYGQAYDRRYADDRYRDPYYDDELEGGPYYDDYYGGRY